VWAPERGPKGGTGMLAGLGLVALRQGVKDLEELKETLKGLGAFQVF